MQAEILQTVGLGNLSKGQPKYSDYHDVMQTPILQSIGLENFSKGQPKNTDYQDVTQTADWRAGESLKETAKKSHATLYRYIKS